MTAHEICDPNVALIAGQLMLQRAVYIRNTFKFRLSWEYCLLDPMDLVTVTDTILGLSRAAVRITEIEEDENGFLQVTAEEFPLGVASATRYETQPVTNNPVNTNVACAHANAPIIFEPPRRWCLRRRSGLRPPAAPAALPTRGGAACNVWLSSRRHVVQPDRYDRRTRKTGLAHRFAWRISPEPIRTPPTRLP